jgi:hypothetical protein
MKSRNENPDAKIKRIPASHFVWVRDMRVQGTTFITTTRSQTDRSTYFLWEQTKDGVEKVMQAKTPKDFERYILDVKSKRSVITVI